jgi:hypothetical protein
LAAAGPELRDELFIHRNLFDANPHAWEIREHFRSEIEKIVPGAYRADSNRVYAPIEAACEARDSVIQAIAEFAESLKSIKQSR